MGVDLGGGGIGEAQQGLDHAQVGAALKQVGGEGVAQDVGADAGRVDPGVDGGLVQQLGEAARGQVAPGRGRGEQPRTVRGLFGPGGVAGDQPGFDRLAGGSVQGGQPLLAALAAHDQEGGVAPHRLDPEAQQFGHPEPRGVGQFDEGDEAQARRPVMGGRGRQQSGDLVAGQGPGQAPALFGSVQPSGRVVRPPALAEGEAIELPHRRTTPGLGRGRQAATPQIGVPGLDRRLVAEHQAAGDARLGVGEVAAIG